MKVIAQDDKKFGNRFYRYITIKDAKSNSFELSCNDGEIGSYYNYPFMKKAGSGEEFETIKEEDLCLVFDEPIVLIDTEKF